MEKKELITYDFEKSFAHNFIDDEDKYMVIRISNKDDKIEVVPDIHSVCLSKPSKLLDLAELKYLIWDYDTIFGTRYRIFKNYSQMLKCDERVLFETLLIQNKANKFKPFRWEKSKIGYELGISRGRIDSAIRKFKEKGIIKSTVTKSFKTKGKLFDNSTVFTLDCHRIHELIPQIFSSFDYKKMEHDLHKYLAPVFNEK